MGRAAKAVTFSDPQVDYRFCEELFHELDISSLRTSQVTIAGVPCMVFSDADEYKYRKRWVLDGTSFAGTIAIFANPAGWNRLVKDVQLTVKQVIDRCDLFSDYHQAYMHVYGKAPLDVNDPPPAPPAECNAA